jgi:hypothetical protein
MAVRHGRYVTFKLAEDAVQSCFFQKILNLIDDVRRIPSLAKAEDIHGAVKIL